MNGWPLPGPLIEAGNWMMVVLFAAMQVSAGIYFFGELRRHHWLLMETYTESKASWAATMLFHGLFVRTFDVALVRHFQNHGHPVPWETGWAAVIFVYTTIPIVWGSVCWMRAVLPFNCASWAWAALTVFAAALGVYLAAP